jgi:ComF family protein
VSLRMLDSIRDGLVGVAYPAQCRVCGEPIESWNDGVACADCWNDPIIELEAGDVCDKCGISLSRAASSARARTCGMCDSLPFTTARCCGRYAGALEASILFLKANPHICARLRDIICRTFAAHQPALDTEVVMPVPLHLIRRRSRGFNQAAIIARLISHKFNLDLDERSLIRSRPTERHRAGMDGTDRARSVDGAFQVVRPRLIEGASVLLVDDVFTTGSTICAATRCLTEAGVRQVKALTIARATNS